MLRQPTESDVRELLLSVGVRFTDKGDYFQLFCPFHQNKRTASAVIYKDKWLFICFGCGTNYSFSKLYEELKGVPWNEHGSFSMVPVPSIKNSLTEEYRNKYEIEDGVITSVFDNAKALGYCRSRSIKDDFMQMFDFQATDLCSFKKIDSQGKKTIWIDRLLIPIKYNGMPYSLEGRDYTRKQEVKCLYPKGCSTDICFNQDNLDINDLLVVCEGIMDIHSIWSDITKNVTCTFGVKVTKNQISFLKSAKKLVLFIDDDPAGHTSVSIFEKFMENDFKVAVVNKKDPGEATFYELDTAIRDAKNWVDFLMEKTDLFDKPTIFSLGKV